MHRFISKVWGTAVDPTLQNAIIILHLTHFIISTVEPLMEDTPLKIMTTWSSKKFGLW